MLLYRWVHWLHIKCREYDTSYLKIIPHYQISADFRRFYLLYNDGAETKRVRFTKYHKQQHARSVHLKKTNLNSRSVLLMIGKHYVHSCKRFRIQNDNTKRACVEVNKICPTHTHTPLGRYSIPSCNFLCPSWCIFKNWNQLFAYLYALYVIYCLLIRVCLVSGTWRHFGHTLSCQAVTNA